MSDSTLRKIGTMLGLLVCICISAVIGHEAIPGLKTENLKTFIEQTIELNSVQSSKEEGRAVSVEPPTFFYPGGKVPISKTIVIGDGTPNTNSTFGHAALIQGKGSGANEGELGGMPSGTVLEWVGPNTGEPMIWVKGPIHGVRVQDLVINCNGKCNGIRFDHAVNSSVDRVAIRNTRNYNFLYQGTSPARPGMAVGAGGTRLTQVRGFVSTPGSDGFVFGSADVNNTGLSSLILEDVSVLCATPQSVGFRMRFVDYVDMSMTKSLYCGQSVYMDPPAGSNYYPSAIYMRFPAFDRPPTAAPNWSPYPNPGIILRDYHREWNGGTPWLDSSFGPPMPKHRDIWGNDNLNLYR